MKEIIISFIIGELFGVGMMVLLTAASNADDKADYDNE